MIKLLGILFVALQIHTSFSVELVFNGTKLGDCEILDSAHREPKNYLGNQTFHCDFTYKDLTKRYSTTKYDADDTQHFDSPVYCQQGNKMNHTCYDTKLDPGVVKAVLRRNFTNVILGFRFEDESVVVITCPVATHHDKETELVEILHCRITEFEINSYTVAQLLNNIKYFLQNLKIFLKDIMVLDIFLDLVVDNFIDAVSLGEILKLDQELQNLTDFIREWKKNGSNVESLLEVIEHWNLGPKTRTILNELAEIKSESRMLSNSESFTYQDLKNLKGQLYTAKKMITATLILSVFMFLGIIVFLIIVVCRIAYYPYRRGLISDSS